MNRLGRPGQGSSLSIIFHLSTPPQGPGNNYQLFQTLTFAIGLQSSSAWTLARSPPLDPTLAENKICLNQLQKSVKKVGIWSDPHPLLGLNPSDGFYNAQILWLKIDLESEYTDGWGLFFHVKKIWTPTLSFWEEWFYTEEGIRNLVVLICLN